MKKILLSLTAVLMCVLIFCGCEALSTDGAQSGAQASTEGEPSVSESAAEGEQSEPSQEEKADESGEQSSQEYETVTFMEDEESVAKLKEKYPGIDDWQVLFEQDLRDVDWNYSEEKQKWESTPLPTRLVLLTTEQSDGFNRVFACAKYYIETEYHHNEETGRDEGVSYVALQFDSVETDGESLAGIDFSGAQMQSPAIWFDNIPYILSFENATSVMYFSNDGPVMMKFEGATEPVKLSKILAAEYWSEGLSDFNFILPESRKNDYIITTVNDEKNQDWTLWYYSAADGTARMFEGLESFTTSAYGFVSDTCMGSFKYSDGIFRYYDFSDGADPTKCIWTLSGDGGGLLGGKVTAAVYNFSIMDKNDNDRLVILYAEDESKMYWICSYTLEDGVQSNFCLDLPAKGTIGSCNVRSGVTYFSYHRGKERVNYAVDVRPDKDHTLQANAW